MKKSSKDILLAESVGMSLSALKRANKILSRQIYRGVIISGKEKEVTERQNFGLWKSCYPDTYKWILRAMNEYRNT